MQKFSLLDYLTYVDIYRINFINTVPAMQQMMCRVENPGRFNLKSIESMTSGAAPLDHTTACQFKKLFLRPSTHVRQGWGMTETTWNVTGFSPDDSDDGRSIGWLNPNCKARIVSIHDGDHPASPAGEKTGELWISGPNIMKGYWRREQETSETIVTEGEHRWLRTGDIVYADNRGCFYIVGRIKAGLPFIIMTLMSQY